MGKIRDVESQDEFQDVIDSAGNQLVVADFWASWCGPCRLMGPHFHKIAEEAEFDDVIFIKIDVDELGSNSDLIFDATMTITPRVEATLADMNVFRCDGSTIVHHVRQRRPDGKLWTRNRDERRWTNYNRQHQASHCPVANAKCQACGRLGHWNGAQEYQVNERRP
ncbi:Thioredoxin [Lamellibrachia satsuma]|nr:Thioredoxin [Lamellibrachia satsuma]